MNKYLEKLLKENLYSSCKIIKNIINAGILDYNAVINSSIKTNVPRIIYDIAKEIAKEEDIFKLAETICKTGNIYYIYRFAADIKGAPIDILADAICESNSANVAEFILAFTKIENAPINKLADAICRTKNCRYIYNFAMEVKNAPIDKLANAICNLGDAHFIICFASEIENAPIDELAKAIIKTDSAAYIYSFIIDIKNISKELYNDLIDALIRLNAEELIENILENVDIKETDILNKIKCYLPIDSQSYIQYKSLIRAASNNSEDLITYSEIYRELLGVNSKNNKTKRRVLKSGINRFVNKNVNPLKNTD